MKITETPLLSIITVVLNGVKKLQRNIDSVKKQQFKRMEHIVIDGGSTDGTVEIIKENEEYIRYWISEKDCGIFDAMNKGIDKAEGEWLLFLNSDDFLYEGIINEIFSEENLIDYDLFYGSMIYLGNGYKYKVSKRNISDIRYPLCCSHPATFFRRSYLRTFNGYNTQFKICGDYELFLKMAKQGFRHKFINKPISVISVGGVSDRLSSILRIIVERFTIDCNHIGSVFASKNFIFWLVPCYMKQLIKKLLLFLGLKKIVAFYYREKYKKLS